MFKTCWAENDPTEAVCSADWSSLWSCLTVSTAVPDEYYPEYLQRMLFIAGSETCESPRFKMFHPMMSFRIEVQMWSSERGGINLCRMNWKKSKKGRCPLRICCARALKHESASNYVWLLKVRRQFISLSWLESPRCGIDQWTLQGNLRFSAMHCEILR